MTLAIRHKISFPVIITLLIFAFTGYAYGDYRSNNYIMLKDVFSGEGQGGSSPNYNLQCTLGQSSAIGESSGNSHMNYAGFWTQVDDDPLPPDPVISLTPSNKEVGLQTSFTTQVEIKNVSNLGGFEFEIHFDPSLVCAQDINLNDFLSSTGRTTLPLSDSIDCNAGIIKYAVTTMGPSPPGPDGDGVLATINWLSSDVKGVSDITFQNVQLTHPDSTLISHNTQNATVKITDNLSCPHDLNNDNLIDIIDVTTVAYAYGCNAEDDCYNQKYDFNNDGAIDIVDVTSVAYDYGTSCNQNKRSVLTETMQNNNMIKRRKTSTPVKVISDNQTFEVGQTFTTDIMIYDVENLGSFEFELNYDSSILEAQKIQLGDFLGSTGRNDLEVVNNIDNESGVAKYAVTTLGAIPPGPDGNGVLATITWHTKAAGETVLDPADIKVTQPDASTIDVTTEPLTITVSDITVSDSSYVKLVYANLTAKPGQTFTTDIMIYNVEDLGSFEFELNFDPSVIEGKEIQLGDFIGSTGRTDIPLESSIDNNAGVIKYAVSTLGQTPPGPSGDGLLATITWYSKASGKSVIDLANIKATHPNASVISIIIVKPGDANYYKAIDLTDAILALRVAAGIGNIVYSYADTNGDGKIGLEEVVFALQIVAEMRQ
ncbi:MAG: hypothetical protein GY749_46650 [Desulfobacteraceae bacterium]|nr:hypothetical protein [Desulfobacteraceae bacterium]